MSYIILNGVRSSLIKGLLIQSLPPISKPLIRTQVQTIDGRDGDIVTKLGYSAYDKTMTIGLFGDYDIDQVIEYFNSEGTVIFSNEPGKFYEYQILNQIDFEKLLRFKTATVTFHVQPFKYSAVDDKVEVGEEIFHPKNYSATKNGVTVTVSNEQMTIVGTATEDTEFYIPIEQMVIEHFTPTQSHSYRYRLGATGGYMKPGQFTARVIIDKPNDADSFGGTSFVVEGTVTTSVQSTDSPTKIYKYLWIKVASGTTLDLTPEISVLDLLFASEGYELKYINSGNVESKPIITLKGLGYPVHVYINDVNVFDVTLDNWSAPVTINLQTMNAYSGSTLKNRKVTGDLSKISFKRGINTMRFVCDNQGFNYGAMGKVTVEKESRWI